MAKVMFKFNKFVFSSRPFSTRLKNDDIQPMITNRNPRNLEKLRIAYKPSGYHLEKPGRCFWHKLELETSARYVKASINHFENGPVITASTQEWPIKRQLYRCNDASAYMNLGRVLARRCIEFGVHEVCCTLQPAVLSESSSELQNLSKLQLFLKALQEGGVQLEEAEQYKKPRPWDQHRPEKPWEIE